MTVDKPGSTKELMKEIVVRGEGQRVNMSCTIKERGNPSGTILWYTIYPYKPVGRGDSYVIPRTKYADRNAYNCACCNYLGCGPARNIALVIEGEFLSIPTAVQDVRDREI